MNAAAPAPAPVSPAQSAPTNPMKFILRWAFRLFLVVVVLVVAGVLLMDTIIKSVLENRIREQTGRDVKIGKFELSILNSRVTIENFKLYDTAANGGGPFLDMPEIHLELDRAALSQHQLHFKLIRLHMAELNLVQSGSGRGGLGPLPQLNPASLTNQIGRAERPRGGSDQLQFAGIDTLNLTLGKIKQTDLKQPANSREFALGVTNRVFTGIRDERDLQVQLLPLLFQTAGPLIIQLYGGLPSLPPAAAAPDLLAPIPGTAPRK